MYRSENIMNRRNVVRLGSSMTIAALALITAGGPALAERGGHSRGRAHVGVGIYWGPPVFGYPYPYPYAFPYPYYPEYYPPAVIAVPSEPPQYMEQGDTSATPQAPEPSYWYHCARPAGYYPYVKNCPGGWQKVPAEPPER